MIQKREKQVSTMNPEERKERGEKAERRENSLSSLSTWRALAVRRIFHRYAKDLPQASCPTVM
jgi:hypothetical protein